MTEHRDRTFDWVPSRDPKNADYPLRALLPRRIAYRYVHWGLPSFRIDQGPDGACVGFSCVNEALSSPIRVRTSASAAHDLAHHVYRSAQRIDEWPGEDYEGTSVNAGAKIMRELGYIGGWGWAQTFDDIRRALCTPARDGGGPVVFGSPWYERMFDPEPGNLIRPGGSIVGGHAYLIVGYHPHRRVGGTGEWRTMETFTILNSWGPGWGRRGIVFITAEDLALLFDQGEAALFQQRSSP